MEAEIGRIDAKEAKRMTGRVKRQADLLIRLLHKKFTNEPAEIEDQVRTHQPPVAVCINRARLLSRIFHNSRDRYRSCFSISVRSLL